MTMGGWLSGVDWARIPPGANFSSGFVSGMDFGSLLSFFLSLLVGMSGNFLSMFGFLFTFTSGLGGDFAIIDPLLSSTFTDILIGCVADLGLICGSFICSKRRTSDTLFASVWDVSGICMVRVLGGFQVAG